MIADWNMDGPAPFGGGQLAALAATQAVGIAFWFFQNRGKRTGGGLSFVKGLWLTYAVTLWFVVPALLFFTTTGSARSIYGLLAASMLARGVIELYLCYVTKTWRAAYGVSHDLLQLALALGGLAYYFGSAARPEIFTPALLVLTILSLAAELVFVRWFLAATGGPAAGVYFVSGEKKFDRINRGTAWLFFPQYGAFLALLLLALRQAV